MTKKHKIHDVHMPSNYDSGNDCLIATIGVDQNGVEWPEGWTPIKKSWWRRLLDWIRGEQGCAAYKKSGPAPDRQNSGDGNE